MIAKYRKFLVALLGLVIIALNTFLDLDIEQHTETIINLVVSLLTALGVWAVPNEPSEPSA